MGFGERAGIRTLDLLIKSLTAYSIKTIPYSVLPCKLDLEKV